MSFLPILFLLALLTPHSFVEYQVTVHIGNLTAVNLLIETVEKVYPNGTFTFNLTVIFLNTSEAPPPSILLDNLSLPRMFYYFPTVGSSVIPRLNVLAILNKTGNDCWVYYGYNYIGYNVIEQYYFINASGLANRIVLIQKNQYGQIVSVTDYKLIKTNIINKEEKPLVPKGIKPVSHTVEVGFLEGFNESLGQYIVLFNVIAVPVLIAVKKVVKGYVKKVH